MTLGMMTSPLMAKGPPESAQMLPTDDTDDSQPTKAHCPRVIIDKKRNSVEPPHSFSARRCKCLQLSVAESCLAVDLDCGNNCTLNIYLIHIFSSISESQISERMAQLSAICQLMVDARQKVRSAEKQASNEEQNTDEMVEQVPDICDTKTSIHGFAKMFEMVMNDCERVGGGLGLNLQSTSASERQHNRTTHYGG
jgi:hypothetical protein